MYASLEVSWYETACIDDYNADGQHYITVTKKGAEEQAEADYLFRSLQKEMDNCRRGGHSKDGDWEFE
jgi:hypothetical protein